MNFMMKKGVFPRIAAVLMILTLLSTCVISGTFAKYVTEGSTTATARVAKWGVTINGTVGEGTGSPFKNEYAAADPEGTGLTMSVSADTAVIAPGTSGVLGTVGVSGTPEVAVQITFADPEEGQILDLGDAWMVEGAFYCPLIFTVGDGDDNKIDGSTFDNVDALEKAVAEKIVGKNTYFAAGQDLSTAEVAGGVTIAWEWPFSTSKDNDKKDTALADTGASITFNLAVTVEQVN